MRVLISAHKDFNDQKLAQQAMLELRRQDPSAVIVVGANKGDKLVGMVWKALGGHVVNDEPQFARGVNRKDAMKARDRRVLSHHNDLCISFEIRKHKGWVVLLAEQRRIPIKRYDTAITIVDA